VGLEDAIHAFYVKMSDQLHAPTHFTAETVSGTVFITQEDV
jgi:hypothetical protein